MDTFNLFYTFLELTVYGVSVIQVSSEMKFGGTAWISTGKQSAISLCRIVNLKKKKKAKLARLLFCRHGRLVTCFKASLTRIADEQNKSPERV